MSTLVVKNLPDALHERLRAQAQSNRRSVTQEAIRLLEIGLDSAPRHAPLVLPPPYKLRGGALKIDEIEAAIEHGRE